MSYALDSESLSIIVDAAARLHPTMAVEYGSGVSTAALAGHCGSLLSLEHDRQWLAVTRARLNGVDNVEVRWCRLTRGTYSVTLPDEISFALIDGPRIRDGRQSTLPQLWPSLAPGALVFVDDLHHRPVQRWVDDWRLTLGAQLELLTERLGVIVR